jgi:hypothetical protein
MAKAVGTKKSEKEIVEIENVENVEPKKEVKYLCRRGKVKFYITSSLEEFEKYGLHPKRVEAVLDTKQCYRGYNFETMLKEV